MELLKDIFRKYDIRGIYPSELDADTALLIGKAFGTLLRKHIAAPVVVLGRDDRASSITLFNSFSQGLLSTGCDVINVGVTVEPAIHFFSFINGVDAAVNITASHNPKNYNGIKIDLPNAQPFWDKDLLNLYETSLKGDFITGIGKITEKDLNALYIKYISSKFKLNNKIKTVIYCGNGATSNIYPEILMNIGAEVIPIACVLDSTFPEGVPDPEEGLFYPELSEQVQNAEATIGVGFDGDGDRMGVVDEKGQNYKTDMLYCLYIQDVLAKNKGATILYDVKSSKLVESCILENHGTAKMMPTGRGFFLDEMLSKRALLGAELSGHIYFADDYYGFDDGIYAFCRLLQIMDTQNKKLSELMNKFPKLVSTPEIKLNCEDSKKFEVINDLVKRCEKDSRFSNLITLDGIRAHVSPAAWFLIRASNTSPYLSLRVEGSSQQEVSTTLSTVAELVSKYPFIDILKL